MWKVCGLGTYLVAANVLIWQGAIFAADSLTGRPGGQGSSAATGGRRRALTEIQNHQVTHYNQALDLIRYGDQSGLAPAVKRVYRTYQPDMDRRFAELQRQSPAPVPRILFVPVDGVPAAAQLLTQGQWPRVASPSSGPAIEARTSLAGATKRSSHYLVCQQVIGPRLCRLPQLRTTGASACDSVDDKSSSTVYVLNADSIRPRYLVEFSDSA